MSANPNPPPTLAQRSWMSSLLQTIDVRDTIGNRSVVDIVTSPEVLTPVALMTVLDQVEWKNYSYPWIKSEFDFDIKSTAARAGLFAVGLIFIKKYYPSWVSPSFLAKVQEQSSAPTSNSV